MPQISYAPLRNIFLRCQQPREQKVAFACLLVMRKSEQNGQKAYRQDDNVRMPTC